MVPARLHLVAGLVLVLVVMAHSEEVVQGEEAAGFAHIEGAEDITVVEDLEEVAGDGDSGDDAVTVSSSPEASRTSSSSIKTSSNRSSSSPKASGTSSSSSPGGPNVCSLCSCSTAEGVLTVDCSSRQLDTWPAFTHNYNSSLMTVDMSNNSLTSLPQLPDLPITSLDLSSNSLSSLDPFQFASLAPTLLRLDLSRSQLAVAGLSAASLHLDLEGLDEERVATWRLQELRLADNRLHSLPHDLLAQLGMLETLDLSSNPLVDLDPDTAGAIGGVASLQSLSLASCQLSSLPAGLLVSLTQLGTLDLSDNSFTVVDPLLRTAHSLHSLALDRNLLESLEDTSFQGLEDLRHLSVRGNPHLRMVGEGAMAPLAQLEELRLSDNPQLAWLHPDTWPSDPSAPFPLRILHLSDNALRYLPSMLLPSFADWEVLEELELGGNLWECDCHNQWMITTLLPAIEARSPQRAAEIVCSGPSKSSLVKVGMAEVSKMSINHTTDLPCDQSMVARDQPHPPPPSPRSLTPTRETSTCGRARPGERRAPLGTAWL